jgi:hypothetical protein
MLKEKKKIFEKRKWATDYPHAYRLNPTEITVPPILKQFSKQVSKM